MKQQEKNTETKAESQNGKGIQDAFTGSYQSFIWTQFNYAMSQSPLLVEGQGGGLTIGKAPPGSARSPGAARGHPPENKAGPPGQAEPAPSPLSFGREGPGVSQKTNTKTYIKMNINTLINKTNFNFYKHFKFFIMKKQILILACFLMAVFAGVNKSYGQEASPAPALGAVPTCIVPTPLDALCSGNPLTPLAGVPYTYEVNVPALDAGTKSYNWFVTTSTTFITQAADLSISITAAIDVIATSTHILAVSPIDVPTNYGSYNNLDVTATPDGIGDGNFKIKIAWKYWVHDPNAPVFLVVYVKNDATCDNDNLKVYIIKPTHSFTLDIANIPNFLTGTPGKSATDPTWTPAAEDGPCVAPVSSALWIAPDATYVDGQIVMEYGVNYLYYMVTAANFNNSWLPKFQVSGTGIGAVATRERVVTAIDWQYVATSNSTTTWKATTTPAWDATNTLYASSGALAAGDVPVVALDTKFGGVTGECIIVRVTVANHRIETLIADPITLAVDGRMYDEAGVTAATGATAKAAAAYANADLDDIHYTVGPAGATTEPCPYIDGFAYDKITQNIMPRPDVQSKTAPSDVPFVPVKVD